MVMMMMPGSIAEVENNKGVTKMMMMMMMMMPGSIAEVENNKGVTRRMTTKM